ncbi:DUF4349 domain-containing protein [Streptomyces sp. NPDC102406]|uniref:DUF4349 domain-containing protein n=1 Tax=Streptomyces sp. NPDC102406 TaxID=3366171 RepID=UPI003805B2D4
MPVTTRTRPRTRRARLLAALSLTAVLALAGCSAADDDSGGDQDKSVADVRAPREAGGAADSGKGGGKASGTTRAPKPTDVHIIRTATLSVRVKDVPDALDKARRVAEDAGGIVGDETTGRDEDGRERSRITLRVPQDAYEDVLDRLSGTGRLVERHVTAKDVTDQVVDVDSRIASQRASVARVRELMDRATKLSDVVTLEGELSSRQSALEALLAQQASLKDRTTLATITLSLSETPAKAGTGGDDPGFLDALSGGWAAFVTVLKWLAMALAAVLPFAAVAALLVFLWLRWVRPRLPRRGGSEPVATVPGPLPAHPRSAPTSGTGEQD